MQRRVEQPDRDGQPVHDASSSSTKSARCSGSSASSAAVARLVGVGEDHPLDEHAPVAEEHVLGAAQPDALGPEATRPRRVVAGVGVRAHPQAPDAIGVGQQPVDRTQQVGRLLVGLGRERRRAPRRGSGRPVSRRPARPRGRPHRSSRRSRARRPRGSRCRRRARSCAGRSTSSVLRAADTGLAHAAGDDRGVRRLAAAAVRMPAEAIMPSRSSGFVSRRTRITCSPRAAQLTAVAESKTTLPDAAPGDAAMPRVSRSRSVTRVELREHQLGQLLAR